jgi:hypothetical protein
MNPEDRSLAAPAQSTKPLVMLRAGISGRLKAVAALRDRRRLVNEG